MHEKPKSSVLRNLLWMMHNKNNKCYYCKKRTFLNPPGVKHCRSLTATVEHLYDKSDIRRFITGPYGAIVVACNQCNQAANERSHERLKAINDDCPEVNLMQILKDYRMAQIAEWKAQYSIK